MLDDWPSVAELPPLQSGEVQIWRADLSEAPSDPDIYTSILAPAESERAARFRASQVRMQFVVARACLRVLLGRFMELRPIDVPITLGAYGKPELSSSASRSVFFNVAHSRETILIALCLDARIGVDLEYLDRETDVLDIARNSFTPREFLHIEQARSPADGRKAFFRLWTRKEAVMKADGRGLSVALSAVEVPITDQAVSVPITIAGSEDPDAARGRPGPEIWFITDLDLGEGIASAVAAGVERLHLSTLHLPLGALLSL